MKAHPAPLACPLCGKWKKRRWYFVNGQRICGHCVARRVKRPDGGKGRAT